MDKADTLWAKRRAALIRIEVLFESIFRELFGDPVGNSKGLKKV